LDGVRSRCADGSAAWTFRRARHVYLGGGSPTRIRLQCSVWTRRRRIVRHGGQRVEIGLHPYDVNREEVTVDETSSTKYEKSTTSISKSAITKGQHVLVLGTVSSTNIKSTQVIVEATGGSATSTAASVVPFQKGATTTSKQVGTIPASYSEGSGTIVSGTAANKATEVALAAYPGGIVDRVVKLSNGEYEVHNIGVNWPHHIFVNQDFKVIGAD
jgi:hypothetical protein